MGMGWVDEKMLRTYYRMPPCPANQARKSRPRRWCTILRCRLVVLSSPLAKLAFMCLCLFSEGHSPSTPLVWCSWQWGWKLGRTPMSPTQPTIHRALCKTTNCFLGRSLGRGPPSRLQSESKLLFPPWKKDDEAEPDFLINRLTRADRRLVLHRQRVEYARGHCQLPIHHSRRH